MLLRFHVIKRLQNSSLRVNYPHHIPFKVQKRNFSIISEIQNGVISFHQFSGLPWYMTFAFSSFGVKLFLFPLARARVKMSYNLSSTMPELNSLFQMLTRRLSTIPRTSIKERFKILSVFIQGVKASLKLNDVNLTSIFSYTAASAGIFIAFIFSLRGMMEEEKMLNISNNNNYNEKNDNDNDNNDNQLDPSRGVLGLKEGGTLWFKDLTEKDNTKLLPIVSILSSYLALEFSSAGMTGSRKQLSLARLWKNIPQGLLLLCYPFISVFPAGVFCYWIPVTWLSLLQTRLLKNPTFLRMIFLKPPSTFRR